MADISKIQIDSGTYDIKDEVARENAMKFPNFFIAPFFSGFGDIAQRLIRFFISLDGIHFNATNLTASGIYDNYGADMSLVYDKNTQTFYLAMTSYDETHDCLIYTSKDFLNWTKHEIDLGYKQPHNDLHRWSPSLYISISGIMYLILSVQYKRESNVNYFQQVLFRIQSNNFDENNLNFEKVGVIKLNDTSSFSSYIDGNLAQINGINYFIVKNENTKEIELYTPSYITNINNYTYLKNTSIDGVKLEAPCICPTDSTVNIYCENYIIRQGMNLQQCKISDFPNGLTTNMRYLDTLVDDTNNDTSNQTYNAKHGNVIFITDNHAKQVILNNCQIGLNSYNAIQKKQRNLYLKSFKDYPLENWNKIVAYPNIGWNIGDIDGEINLEILNPYNQRFMYFYFTDTKPRITITKIDNETTNIVLNVDNSLTNDFIIFDIERGKFLMKQKAITLADITNLNVATGSVTYANGAIRGNVVSLEMVINIEQATSSFVKIAEFPVFKPAVCKAYVNSNKAGLYAYIDNEDGGFYVNASEVTSFRVSVSYLS